MCQALDEILEESRAEGVEQGIKQGIKQGIEQDRMVSIRSLKENLKMTTEQAMKALNIPEELFAYYLQLV